MVDADGATKFADLDKLDELMNDIQKSKVWIDTRLPHFPFIYFDS